MTTTLAAESSANKTSSTETNLPTLTLAEALRTNVVGMYKIKPAWTGLCAVVVATGAYTNPEPAAFATNRPIVRFDAVVITSKAAIGHVGPKGLGRIDKDGGYTALHSLRDELPTDSDIRAAAIKDLAAVEKLLGPAHGFPDAVGRGAVPRVKFQWSFAAQKVGVIDTLQIAVVSERPIKSSTAQIKALEVRRGSAREEIKPPKKS